MSGDAVFVAVAIVLIAAWTGYRIWVFRRKVRLLRELERLAREADPDHS